MEGASYYKVIAPGLESNMYMCTPRWYCIWSSRLGLDLGRQSFTYALSSCRHRFGCTRFCSRQRSSRDDQENAHEHPRRLWRDIHMVHEAQLLCACSAAERDGCNKNDKIVHFAREQVRDTLRFSEFLIFHCPVKGDAVETLKVFADL